MSAIQLNLWGSNPSKNVTRETLDVSLGNSIGEVSVPGESDFMVTWRDLDVCAERQGISGCYPLHESEIYENIYF